MIFKCHFGFPKFGKITIFHHEDYWLRRILFKKNKDIMTIPCVPYIPIYFSFSFFLYFLKHLIKREIKGINGNLFKKLYYYYIISILDYSNTKIIVTFIDNSGIFHNLNKIDTNKKRKYFAIQNGSRHKSCAKYSLPKNYKIHLNNLYCFGLRDIKLFNRYNHNIKNFFPVGNIKSSFFFKKIIKTKKIYDICLVSQWNHRFVKNDYKNKIEKKVFLENNNSINILNSYLRKLAINKNYKIAICLRPGNDPEEIDYYIKVLKNVNYVFINNNEKQFSTFKTILKSNLTIAKNSTALSEVFGISKVLWANILNNINFEMPEAGISYFNQKNFIKFQNRVEYLHTMDINKYKKLVKKRTNLVCVKNYNKPAHIAILENLREELKHV